MNSVTKGKVSTAVVPILLGLALALGVPAPAHADDVTGGPFTTGVPSVIVCGTTAFDLPHTCAAPTVVTPPTCHKWRWWVIRNHHKHYYWACHEYPLPTH